MSYALIAGLAFALVVELVVHARERRDLYMRIQAPQLAVARDVQDATPKREKIVQPSIYDDKAMKTARELREGKVSSDG